MVSLELNLTTKQSDKDEKNCRNHRQNKKDQLLDADCRQVSIEKYCESTLTPNVKLGTDVCYAIWNCTSCPQLYASLL